VQVVPISSKIDKVYPTEIPIFINKQSAKTMADQIATVTKERLQRKICLLSNKEMFLINKTIKLQLKLD
jgi:mRNA interferase MazF